MATSNRELMFPVYMFCKFHQPRFLSSNVCDSKPLVHGGDQPYATRSQTHSSSIQLISHSSLDSCVAPMDLPAPGSPQGLHRRATRPRERSSRKSSAPSGRRRQGSPAQPVGGRPPPVAMALVEQRVVQSTTGGCAKKSYDI